MQKNLQKEWHMLAYVIFFVPLQSAKGMIRIQFFSLFLSVEQFCEQNYNNFSIYRLSIRTKVTDYITACGKIDVQTQKIPATRVTGMREKEN